MPIEAGKLLNLIRISDTFFPVGSFAISQAMEQIINENLVPREKLHETIGLYLEKIWVSLELQIFHYALEAAEKNDIAALSKLDEICHSTKIPEENRSALVRMGHNMINAMDFSEGSLGVSYRDLVLKEKTPGTYPVVLAVASKELGLGELGAVSLCYVNVIEVTASLVRMGVIDYIELQRILEERLGEFNIGFTRLSDLNQSFPLVDIASMRHEISKNRMFIS